MIGTTAPRLPYIGERQIGAVLEWDSLIDVIERAMRAFSAGEVEQPVRQLVLVPGHNTIIAAMPAVGEAMVYDSVGIAIMDVAAARLAYDLVLSKS